MEIEKFVDLVERMREAQTSYFKTKNNKQLQRSIILEGLVDEKIKEFNQERKAKYQEPDLFSGT